MPVASLALAAPCWRSELEKRTAAQHTGCAGHDGAGRAIKRPRAEATERDELRRGAQQWARLQTIMRGLKSEAVLSTRPAMSGGGRPCVCRLFSGLSRVPLAKLADLRFGLAAIAARCYINAHDFLRALDRFVRWRGLSFLHLHVRISCFPSHWPWRNRSRREPTLHLAPRLGVPTSQ